MARNKVIIIEAIALVILIVAALIIWINLTLRESAYKPKEPPLTASHRYRFGVIRDADIHVNNMEKGEYTSHGRLK